VVASTSIQITARYPGFTGMKYSVWTHLVRCKKRAAVAEYDFNR
jgi:hypothetical protein